MIELIKEKLKQLDKYYYNQDGVIIAFNKNNTFERNRTIY